MPGDKYRNIWFMFDLCRNIEQHHKMYSMTVHLINHLYDKIHTNTTCFFTYKKYHSWIPCDSWLCLVFLPMHYSLFVFIVSIVARTSRWWTYSASHSFTKLHTCISTLDALNPTDPLFVPMGPPSCDLYLLGIPSIPFRGINGLKNRDGRPLDGW